MKLIDKDAIPWDVEGVGEIPVITKEEIDEMPTLIVDAEPVRHGEWVEYPKCLEYENALTDEHIVCSCCGEVFNVMDNDTYRFKYCPNCGAKMERKDDETD